MPSPKLLNRWGVLLKLEAIEGTFATPDPETDAWLVVERPDVDTTWVHDGASTHPTQKNRPRAGRGHTVSLVHEPAGAGVAYNGTTAVASIRTAARLCGLDVAVDTTEGAEKETYTPSPNNYASASASIYSRGQLYKIAATHGNFTLEAENGGIPKLTVAANGISAGLPTDVAVPAITYAGAQAVAPAVATAMALTIGAWSPQRVKSITLTQELEWAVRYLDNASQHGGFNPGGEPAYTLECVVEAEALATYNPFEIAEEATVAAFSAQFGSGDYVNHKLAAANCQLVELPEQDENNAALWALKFQLKPSTFMGSDHFSWVFGK